jgi:ATP-dependent protease Clp ATPase subunit
MAQPEHSCSFCHQLESKVDKLIHGEDGISICNRCVAVCYDTLRKEGVDVSSRVYSGGSPKTGDEK